MGIEAAIRRPNSSELILFGGMTMTDVEGLWGRGQVVYGHAQVSTRGDSA